MSGTDEAAQGWPDRPGDTALTIKVPVADPLVRAPFPAHVTVLYPFLPESRLDADTEARLGSLLAEHEEFELTFAEFGRYPGVLYLDPWPHDPVTALTKRLTACWPEAVPYRGIFGETALAPHLTLANDAGPDTWRSAYDALEAELAPHLPLTVRVRAVDLIVWDGQAWRDRNAYPLHGGSGP
ncbi:2'-5' RNA ligase family protein [Streptomyces boluensis]|uniref:2'-5' RNA ligase family protein n=1 Tax=Streptomyces boluensis TaxID=1775135 RepID=A0A964UTU5_9ACTN|nr:2'-5' RNA ligase family protein [Streptomyces boluensis]NBE54376.1 2'-5' RNA ligase family protein [Streptomyces boluensis]